MTDPIKARRGKCLVLLARAHKLTREHDTHGAVEYAVRALAELKLLLREQGKDLPS